VNILNKKEKFNKKTLLIQIYSKTCLKSWGINNKVKYSKIMGSLKNSVRIFQTCERVKMVIAHLSSTRRMI